MDNETSRHDPSFSRRPNQYVSDINGARRIVQDPNHRVETRVPPVRPLQPGLTQSPPNTAQVPSPSIPPTQQNIPQSPQPNSVAPVASQQASAANGSIYPQAPSSGTALNQPATMVHNQTAASVDSSKNKTIVTVVMAFGALIAVLAVLSLIIWITAGLKNANEILGIILAVIELVLGVGIFMRRKVARSGYIIVAVILLVFSIYSTVNYLSEKGKYSSAQNSALIGLQSAIKQYQNDNNISSQQRAKYIQVLQKSEAVQKGQSHTVQIPLSAVIEGYIIAIAPLIFLTRLSVKQVFS